MATRNPIERYLAAGMAFTQITRKRAEEMVRELVKEGEVGREKTADLVEQLVAESRRSTEQFAERIRHEVRRQIDALGLVNAEEVSKILERFVNVARTTGARTVQQVSDRAEQARRVGTRQVRRTRHQAEGPLGSTRASAPAKRAAATRNPTGTGRTPPASASAGKASATSKRAADSASKAAGATAKRAAGSTAKRAAGSTNKVASRTRPAAAGERQPTATTLKAAARTVKRAVKKPTDTGS